MIIVVLPFTNHLDHTITNITELRELNEIKITAIYLELLTEHCRLNEEQSRYPVYKLQRPQKLIELLASKPPQVTN